VTSQPDNAFESLESRRAAPEVMSKTHVLYWSIRRELLENRWIYVGQLAVAAVFLVGALISLIHLPARMRALAERSPGNQWQGISTHYDIAAGLMMGILILMALFYSADALYGERRDRSILFWKSLPVSDRTVVLAKASVPLVVLPLLTFIVTLGMHVIMLLASSIVLASNGFSVSVI
jgi:ABC-2 type transport system permease protein